MNIITFLNIIAAVLYLILGINVLTVNIKSKINILFSVPIFCFFFVSLGHVLSDITNNMDMSIFYIKMYVCFLLLFIASSLHFFIELTINNKNKKIINIIIYIPVLLLIIKYLLSKDVLHIDRIIRENNTLFFIYNNSIWAYFYFSIIALYILICFFLLYFWGKKTTSKKIKLQSKIISISQLLSLIFSLSESLILPNFSSYKSSGIHPVIVLIWILGIFYSITKYRFLSLTPELISNYLVSNINESIILLDEKLKIILINKKTEEIIKIEKNQIINNDLSEIILKFDLIKNEIDKMIKNQYKDFSCRIHFKSKDEPVLMDLNFSKVFDKYNDLIGILVIGNEVKELKQLKLFYKLSDREIEIVQLIIEGLSNKEIAVNTSLTENTVKSHVMHIFNKLSVNGRVEMINLLTEYNLIPRDSNKKKIILSKY